MSLTGLFIACDPEREADCRFETGPVDAKITPKGNSPVLMGPSVFSLNDHFVWGASVLRAEEDGQYYMVYSAPEAGIYPFNDAWVYGSKMGLAVSDRPDGSFVQLGFFMNEDGFVPDTSSWDAQTVMNPHLRRFEDKYYLYYVGGREATHLPVRTNADTLDRRSRIQQMLCIGVVEFDSFKDLLKGDFTKSESPLLVPRTRVKLNDIVDPSPEGVTPKPDNIIVVNPSVVYRPSDRKYLLYFKGNIYDPHWRGVHGVAIGDSPKGPFTSLDIEVFNLPAKDGQKLSAEDPYVWYDQNDRLFYAIFKDFTGDFTRSEPCLALMYSKDGIDWKLPEHSLFTRKELTLTSGETVKLHRLERPQLLLDERGEPQVLYVACSIEDVNPRYDGSSFNTQIPIIAHKKR